MKRTDPNYIHHWKGKKFPKTYRNKIALSRIKIFGNYIDGIIFKCPKCKEIKPKESFYKDSCISEVRFPCKKCVSLEYQIKRKNEPWNLLFSKLKSKCKTRYGKNIKRLFTSSEEIKFLWFRDNAQCMKTPSIDRKNNNDHYYLENCHFIEKCENSWKRRHIDYPTIYHDINCLNCKKTFTVKNSRFLKNPKYCSRKCLFNYKKLIKNQTQQGA